MYPDNPKLYRHRGIATSAFASSRRQVIFKGRAIDQGPAREITGWRANPAGQPRSTLQFTSVPPSRCRIPAGRLCEGIRRVGECMKVRRTTIDSSTSDWMYVADAPQSKGRRGTSAQRITRKGHLEHTAYHRRLLCTRAS